MSSVMADEYPDFQNFDQKGRANGWRYPRGERVENARLTEKLTGRQKPA